MVSRLKHNLQVAFSSIQLHCIVDNKFVKNLIKSLKMSLKRKLTQDDLRKAMSEHKKKLRVTKKIDSPLAKYPFYIIL